MLGVKRFAPVCLKFLVMSVHEVKHPLLSNRLVTGTILAFQNSICIMLDLMMAEGETNAGRLQDKSNPRHSLP